MSSTVNPPSSAIAPPLLPLNMEVVTRIFHEFRTPLTAVHQFSSIMRDELVGEVNAKQADVLEIIHRNATKIDDLLEDLRTFVHMRTGTRVELDSEILSLPEIVERELARFQKPIQTKALDVDYAAAKGRACVEGDPRHLGRAVRHLLSNAIAFSRDSGTIRVRAAVNRDTPAPVAWVSIEDQGIGIPSDEIPRVLEPFYRARRASQFVVSGLGLGLTVTREIMRWHKGVLRIVSEGGTTALLALPLRQEQRLSASGQRQRPMRDRG